MRDFIRVDVSACLMGAFLLLTLPLNWLLSALAAAAFHELCHGAAILLLGGRIWGVRISAGGAVMETEPLSSGKELVCALAGPAGSLLLVLMFLGCSHGWRSAHWCRGLSICCRCSHWTAGGRCAAL